MKQKASLIYITSVTIRYVFSAVLDVIIIYVIVYMTLFVVCEPSVLLICL